MEKRCQHNHSNPRKISDFLPENFFSNLDIILCEWNNLGQFLFNLSWLHFYSMYTNEGCPRVRGQSCFLSFLKWVYIFILYIEMSVIKSQIKLKKFWMFSLKNLNFTALKCRKEYTRPKVKMVQTLRSMFLDVNIYSIYKSG